MNVKNDVTQIRKDISGFVGSPVWLESGKGKQKSTRFKGVIEKVYPSIFTILACDGSATKRTLSFSYADVLTKTVEITICE